MPVSSRKQPYIGFDQKREAGNEILEAENLTKAIGGEIILKNVSFKLKKGDKVVLLGRNDLAKTVLLDILSGALEADSGRVIWGATTIRSYFPTDNGKYFENLENCNTLVDWLRQYSEDKDESFIRGFLGKMLFSRDEALKKPNGLSGGEKVRCMFAKMMLSGANVLLLDGPTNHLDLESIAAVNESIVRYKGTVIFTSHDHEFMQTSANRVIELADPGAHGAGVKFDRETTYDNYIEMNKPPSLPSRGH